MVSDYFTCRCPEPDPPGWAHIVPLDCSPLKEGQTIEEWREAGYGYWDDFLLAATKLRMDSEQ